MEKVPRCISNSHATLICTNETCKHANPFVCNTPDHKCKEDHKECLKLQWIAFKQKLDQNKKTTNPLFEPFCDKVNRIINDTIQQLKGMLNDFNNWKKQYGEIERIREFYECIQLNKEARWTGKKICQLKDNKKIKFDDIKIDPKKNQNITIEIQQKKIQFLNTIRKLYEVQHSKKTIKLKSKHLRGLTMQLDQLQQQPVKLQLKFCINMLLCRCKQLKILIEYQSIYYAAGINELNYVGSIPFNYKALSQTKQFAKLFQDPKFHNLKKLKIYLARWTTDKLYEFEVISEALMKLPKLEQFAAVVSDFSSEEIFKPLGNRFKMFYDADWHKNEKWQ